MKAPQARSASRPSLAGTVTPAQAGGSVRSQVQVTASSPPAEVVWQPDTGRQASIVHGSPSSQAAASAGSQTDGKVVDVVVGGMLVVEVAVMDVVTVVEVDVVVVTVDVVDVVVDVVVVLVDVVVVLVVEVVVVLVV